MYNDFRTIPRDPLDTGRMFAEELIREKDREIERLKGTDTEKDAEICKKIRGMIMEDRSAEDIKNLTAALANMMNVILRKET